MGIRSWRYGCMVLIALWSASSTAQPLRSGGTDWYPYSYEDDQGQAKGIAVDVVKQAMAQNGLQMEFLFYPANRLNLLLDNGTLDLNYADSPAWNAPDASTRFVYSRPYLRVREYLYFLSAHPERHSPLVQLQGLHIGLIRGYSYPRLADMQLQVVETSEDAALLDLLLRGRVDAIAMADDVLANLLATRQLDPKLITRSVQLSDAPLVIKLQRQFSDQLPALNATLKKLMDSGEVERIRREYLSRDANPAQ
ncbi:MAG: transporter substrate-binding domain-containing protein, partial [Gammaproteobacteria bacterium]|nr:transporter substrate-binding domain-containing protein [Gammaproteobacteria bacterium]MBU1489637.1 transporter substrate-binding domain-containing protein [Gammaproteobacteria bacterium]MBU2137262.1 transporter substrate-binding domain-containing protein [Gammaproteobacteria bacterium]MBU2215752.1 transporter substrate-binding domain-containing protein [Gammaproteobacteria bacterium]MBU2322079.1 transporter substrate-binding domain-containing protein [Gammaproteobacteria bacterium]